MQYKCCVQYTRLWYDLWIYLLLQLCQSLMDKNVFEPVCAKPGETTKYQFEDSSSKLYRFSGDQNNKENDTPNQSYVEEESVCQLEETHDNSDMEDDLTNTPPEHLRLV